MGIKCQNRKNITRGIPGFISCPFLPENAMELINRLFFFSKRVIRDIIHFRLHILTYYLNYKSPACFHVDTDEGLFIQSLNGTCRASSNRNGQKNRKIGIRAPKNRKKIEFTTKNRKKIGIYFEYLA